MKLFLKHLTFACIIGLSSLAACVPAKKYKALQDSQRKLEVSKKGTERQLASLQSSNNTLRRQISILEDEKRSLNEQLRLQAGQSQNQNNQFNQAYNKLQQDYQSLYQNSQQQSQTSQRRISMLESQVAQLQQSLQVAQANQGQGNFNGQGNQPNQGNFSGINSVPGGGNNYPAYTASSGGNTSPAAGLLAQISNGLSAFNREEVSIKEQGGKVVIDFLDNALFANPNYDLSDRGIQAVKNIAQILQQQLNNNSVHLATSPPSPGMSNAAIILKMKALGSALRQEGLAYEVPQKSFTPLAFETSGTGQKPDQTTFIITP